MTGGFGLGLAALALLCQVLATLLAMPSLAPTSLALPFLAMPAARAAAALDGIPGAGVICRTGGVPVRDEAPAHRPAECALCPVCAAAAPPFPVPAPPAMSSAIPRRHRAIPPPAHAGPAAGGHRFAAQPRGPPAQA